MLDGDELFFENEFYIMNVSEIREKIIRGELDINNQQNFFSTLIKGAMYSFNQYLKIRGKMVPHYIMNTGDDIMYLELKDYHYQLVPCDAQAAQLAYGTIPRCNARIGAVNVPLDQLSSPYSRGAFNIEYDGNVYAMTAQMRRIPVTLTMDLEYTLDSFTDTLDLTQQIISHWQFIKTFDIQYLGKTITCSYKIPENISSELNVTFSDGDGETKVRKITLSIDVESNYPLYQPESTIEASATIHTLQTTIITPINERSDYTLK